MSDLLIPGRRRGKDIAARHMMEELAELYAEYHFSSNGPFKMLRLDRYFVDLEKALVFMRPTRGGKEWDNRRSVE